MLCARDGLSLVYPTGSEVRTALNGEAWAASSKYDANENDKRAI
jgi:hypothetical protein